MPVFSGRITLSIGENPMKIRAVVFKFFVSRQTDRQTRGRTLFYNMYRLNMIQGLIRTHYFYNVYKLKHLFSLSLISKVRIEFPERTYCLLFTTYSWSYLGTFINTYIYISADKADCNSTWLEARRLRRESESGLL